MTRAQVMQWLLTLGNDWVSLADMYSLFRHSLTVEETLRFWDVLGEWHDDAYITKRINHKKFEAQTEGIEEYKLTKKALTLLGERTEDE